MFERIGKTDWPISSVYDLATWRNGLAFKNIDFADVGRPVIKITELKNGVTQQTARTAAQYDPTIFVGAGDMLFSWSGNPDTSIDVFQWHGEDGWLNQHIFKVTPRTGISEEFLFFLLRWLRPRFAEIARNKQTTGLGHVTIQDLRRMMVGVPSIKEQSAIISIVGPLQEKIDVNRRMNETLEAMARAIFKDWFVDFGPTRAKVEGRAPYLAPKIWALFPERLDNEGKPEGWERMRLREAAEVLSGGTPDKSKAEYWGGSIPWISPKAMTEIHVSNSAELVTPHAIGNGTRITPSGSVLLMVRGMGLHLGVRISQARRDISFNQDVKALIPRGIAPVHLLFGMLDAAPFLFAKVEASGHGTGKLPTDIIETIEFISPTGAAYAELVEPLDAINERIALNNQESITLSRMRDLLLPKLMSGQIRPRDAETLIEMTTSEKHAVEQLT